VRREVRATANRLANFDDANLRRSARAAVAAGARVERAFEILGDEVPEHLARRGELRLAHKQASLEELGQLADPVLTKDAVAGRIRRLLAMADKRAADLGIPDTESGLTRTCSPRTTRLTSAARPRSLRHPPLGLGFLPSGITCGSRSCDHGVSVAHSGVRSPSPQQCALALADAEEGK
jgi:hypothetical protein